MKNRTLLLWLGALGPLSSALHAQQAGSIRGVITDKDFGGPVIEATVTIIGRPETAKTADQGNYLLRELPPGTYTVVLKGVAKLAYARNPQAAERARTDADRITSLAKDRAARVVAAKEAVAAAQGKQQPDSQVAEEVGKELAKELAKELQAATEAVKVAEAAAQAAETERARREEAAKAAATAAAPKDIDVPVVVAPITIVVVAPMPPETPKPAEPPKQPEPPKP